jgi:MutS domain V
METSDFAKVHTIESSERPAINFPHVQRLLKSAQKKESQFAFLRFGGAVFILAVFFSIGSKFDITIQFLLGMVFIILFILMSIVHKKFSNRVFLWECFLKVKKNQLARKERNFVVLREFASPWHAEVIRAIPPNHVFASDLDISSNFFEWFNSCATMEGSKALLENILELKPCQGEPQKFVKHWRMLNALEALRFAPQMESEWKPATEEKPEKENLPTSKTLFIFFIFSLVFWSFLLIPAWMSFFQTGKVEQFLQKVFAYLPIPILGVFLLQKIQSAQSHKKNIFAKIQNIFSIILQEKSGIKKTDLSLYQKVSNAHGLIKNVRFLSSLLELRGNPVFWLFLHVIVPFDAIVSMIWVFQFKKLEAHFTEWFNLCVLFDSTSALSRVKAENKESSFLNQTQQNSVGVEFKESFHIENMGHPLIPFAKRVCNSFTLAKNVPVVVLTGSNMAGKSTFLRTFGTNLVLRAIGAPVFASSFQGPSVDVYCAIRVNDELESGKSYFFAEVSRLAFILKNLKPNSLVLVDEIYRGTNNKERFVGSWSMLLELAERSVFAMVSTHDLALAKLPSIDPRLSNMHFREHVENNTLLFDYKLREGPCPTTNALFIMKNSGLPVRDEALKAVEV